MVSVVSMSDFYFIFVDESGSPGHDSRDPYFALGSVIVKAEDIPFIEGELYNLMNSKGFVSHVELHANEIIHGRGRGSRRTPYEFLTFEFRKQLLYDVINLLVQLPITIIGVIIRKETVRDDELETKTYAEGVLRSAYRLLVERICRFLEEKNGKGILVIDLPERKEATVWKFWIRHEIERGPFTNPEVLISIPLFVDSATSRLIQVTDLVAYIIRRYWLIRDKSEEDLTSTDTLIKELFERIKPKIRAGPDGRIEGYGIKHWTWLGGLPTP